MKKLRIFFLLLAVAVIASVSHLKVENLLMAADPVPAQEDWKSEFEAVCSKTQDAMTFSTDELKNLIARCDKLKPLIDKLDESPRKVYLRRLQLCKDLFVFVLESKERK
ncbi:MAG: hypothetical protein HZB30_00960 [Nitrospirae bacterium]|nr:hypothetical protein [Nitrospirota bacterium]